jgi:tetratricopeptide (TPR) repeat protein
MPDLHLYAADTLAQLGRFEEAEHHLRREIELFPDNMWGYLSLANLYRAFERPAEADSVLSVMMRRVPSADARAAAAKLRTKTP